MLPPAVAMKMEFTPAENRTSEARRAVHLVDCFIVGVSWLSFIVLTLTP
jgi:hypothetical protein